MKARDLRGILNKPSEAFLHTPFYCTCLRPSILYLKSDLKNRSVCVVHVCKLCVCSRVRVYVHTCALVRSRVHTCVCMCPPSLIWAVVSTTFE